MFNQVFDNFRRATEATVRLQQEMFKTWLNLWPGVPTFSPAWGVQVQLSQKKWSEAVQEMLKRQEAVTKDHFQAGVQLIEKAFKLGEAKTLEELRARNLELWQKCFEDLRLVYESQLRGFETAMEKWAEMVTKPAT